MKVSPLFSVVIPTYNHAHFLVEALRSVRNQTLTEWEALVINNYSEDDTITVVESFADSRIRLENFRNHGVIAASRNRGIKLARGRYIAFLDSDDVWYPTKLAQCIARHDEGFDLVCHGLRWVGPWGTRDVFYGPERRATLNDLLYNGNCIATSATTVLRETVESVGGFSENPAIITAEDYHLWIKLAQARAKIGFIKNILGEYRFHAGNESGAVLRHMAAVRSVVTGFLSELPSTGLMDHLRARRRLSIIYYTAARGMQDSGQFSSAWPWFLRALSYWPFYVKTHVAMALNAIRRGPYS